MKFSAKLYWFKLLLVSLFGSVLLVNLLGFSIFRLDAFEFEIGYQLFAGGGTTVVLPPLGSVFASTHRIPLHINMRLHFVDLNLLGDTVAASEEYHLILLREGRRLLFYSFLQVVGLAILGSTLSVYLFFGREKSTLIKAAVLSLIIVLILVTATYFSYDLEAFRDPVYSGTLEAAPWMIGLIEESLFRLEELNEKLQLIAENVYLFFEKIEELQPLGIVDEDLTILHVSDIHNNVVALDFMEQMVENFDVDLIIDTGDMVDYGTPAEAGLVGGLKNLGVPYIFVPGNHDSPQVVEALEQFENVHILRDHLFFSGLHIVGLPDPLSSAMEFRSSSPEEIEEYRCRLEDITSGNKPHILAVHDPRIIENASQLAPVILTGHTHKKKVVVEEDSIRINAGTTGAAGIRTLETSVGSPPYTMVLLRFAKEEKFRLSAVDTVTVMDREGVFTLKRYLINRELDP